MYYLYNYNIYKITTLNINGDAEQFHFKIIDFNILSVYVKKSRHRQGKWLVQPHRTWGICTKPNRAPASRLSTMSHCHPRAETSCLLSARWNPRKQRVCAFEVLIPLLVLTHLPGQPQNAGRVLEWEQELAGGCFRPSTSRGNLGEWATASMPSLPPPSSWVLPSMNFACGQVHTQHTLSVTLDRCLLFIIKRQKPPNEHMRTYMQQWSLFFFPLMWTILA